MRLFCFPHAGGSAAFFGRWLPWLPPWLQLCPVELPGRGSRIREQPLREVRELIAAFLGDVQPLFDRPFAFFGHSMGAHLAFECVRRLETEGPSRAVHLFVSAAAPAVRRSARSWHRLSDVELIDVLGRLQGTPREVLENGEWASTLLPAVRADAELLSRYHPGQDPIGCPLAAYGGAEDPLVDVRRLRLWRWRTTGPYILRLFDGGHFYISSEAPNVVAAICATLADDAAAGTPAFDDRGG
jgi:medium-chain acyl-[acyl-carrier-protein] hydrolase